MRATHIPWKEKTPLAKGVLKWCSVYQNETASRQTHIYPRSSVIYLKSFMNEWDKPRNILLFVNRDPHSAFRDDDIPRIPEYDGHPDKRAEMS